MAVLTGSYQYIGRTNAVSCSAGWNYYILLYAKTSGNIATGKHTVTVLMRLACTSDSTFYGYRTDGYVKIAGTNAVAWSNAQRPGTDWRNSSGITEGGVYYIRQVDLGEGSVEVNTGWGAAKDISISTSWGRVESVDNVPAWLPYYKTYATANITVTLPMIAGASTISAAGNVTLGNACSVRWTPIGASLRYKLRFSLGNWSHTTGVIHPNTTSAYTYTGYVIPLDVAYQIPNSSTGTMTVTLYTYSDSGGSSQVGNADSKTFTVTLPNNSLISISSAGNVTLSNTCSVRWTPAMATLRFKLRFSLGNWSYTTGVIHPNTTAAYTYSGYAIPLDVANQIPNSPTGTMTVMLYTYTDSSGTYQIGNADSKTFTVTVPNNASTKPSVGFSALTPVSSLSAPFNGLYIKGKSRIKVTLSLGGRYGASIVESSFTVDGKTYGNGGTSDYLSSTGTLTISATAKDSRGFTEIYSTSITVHDYAKPTIQVSTCARSDASGNISDTGTSLKIAAQRSVFSVGGNNTCRMWYQWKLATAPDSGFSSQVTLTNNASYSGVITNVVFNTQASYVIRLGVTDGVGETTTAIFTILTEKIYWHRGNDFLALGMYTQNGGFECGWPTRFYSQVYIGDVTLENYIKNLISGGG